MVIETNRLPSNATGHLSPRRERFCYPPLLDLVDLSTQVRFPLLHAGQPAGGLVDALRGHVLVTEAERIAGDKKSLIRGASRTWSIDADSASGVLRASRSGGKALSKSKTRGLVRRFNPLREITEWPWDALHPRRLRKETGAWRLEVSAGREGAVVDGFWQSICSWRSALYAGEARKLAEATSRFLVSLRLALFHPALMGRAIEVLDVVDRLLDLMPPQMLPLDLILDNTVGILTSDEERVLREHIGYSERMLLRRWRHFRLTSRQLVSRESMRKSGASGATYLPWGFVGEARSRNLLEQSRNAHIDLSSRLGGCGWGVI